MQTHRFIFIALLASAFLSLAFGFAAPAKAHELTVGSLTIVDPWARASAGRAKSGAVYMTIHNNGSVADRLVGVETAIARMASIHTMRMEQGVMKMRPLKTLDIPPGASVQLRPGGIHVMLMGLHAPLTQGQTIPVTLRFERAGKIPIEATVESVSARAPRHR